MSDAKRVGIEIKITDSVDLFKKPDDVPFYKGVAKSTELKGPVTVGACGHEHQDCCDSKTSGWDPLWNRPCCGSCGYSIHNAAMFGLSNSISEAVDKKIAEDLEK